MGLFAGKTGLLIGLMHSGSTLWALAQRLHAEGAQLGFTWLPDRDPERPRSEQKIRRLAEPLDAALLMPLDATDDASLDALFDAARTIYGTIDFVVHSLTFVRERDMRCRTVEVSREGFLQAMDISVYSFLTVLNRASQLMPRGGSILTVTFQGSEKVIPGYNLLGVCKAALESGVRYAAAELGPAAIRVNALSLGFLQLLGFAIRVGPPTILSHGHQWTPLQRKLTQKEVAETALFLLSDRASGITGETLHVDGGFHIMGAPPSDFVSFTEGN